MSLIDSRPIIPMADEQSWQEVSWLDLRDDAGRLYGRFNYSTLVLEVRRNQKTITFDLREFLSCSREWPVDRK